MKIEDYIKEHQKVAVEEYPNRVLELLPQPLVSCRISTYNHAPYIAQCIESMLMQQTDFPFEIVIGEDESSDGTREICIAYAKKHPDKIRLFLHRRENNILIDGKPSARFQGFYSIMKCRGKYHAMCEGDDYWTDPHKLQNQVKLLDENPSCTYTGGICQLVKENEPVELYIGSYSMQNGEVFRSYKFLKQNTVLVRRKHYIEVFEKYYERIPMSEYTMSNLLYEEGKGIYYKSVVSVYRITGEGVWSGINKTARLRIHYRKVKAMRKHLKKNWSFHALQELVSYCIIAWQELKTDRKTVFLRHNFWSTLCLFGYFFLRIGFIFAIPPLLHWWGEKRKTKELFI